MIGGLEMLELKEKLTMDKIYVTKHAQLGIEWSGITIRRPKAG